MTLSLHIKNFGKIKKADIAINGLTVFGGTNNIGKSYASRALYAIFDAMNANQIDEYFKFLLARINSATHDLSNDQTSLFDDEKIEKKSGPGEKVLDKIRKYTVSVRRKLSKDGVNAEFRQMVSSMITSTEELILELDKLNDGIKKSSNKKHHFIDITEIPFFTKDIKKAVNELKEAINTSNELILQNLYGKTLKQNFLHNFQISNLNELIGKQKSVPAEIVIKENDVILIGVSILAKEKLKLDIPSPDGLKHLEEFSRVVYLESPMYWKLERPLIDASRTQRRYVSDSPEEILTGVPKYFVDAHNAMTEQRTGKPSIDSDIEKIIDGKIIRNDRDELVFVEKGAKKAISLPLTASGVIQLGMLGHLIETRVIQEGSILFIDEPEAHLHPEWQKRIIEVLYKLSEAGVMVIIATHSPVIMKWIKVMVKKHPEYKEIIALNSFNKKGEFDCIDKGYDENMNEIMYDLTKPFSHLFMRGL